MANTIFTDGTVYKMNKLGMINECLLAIGEMSYPEDTDVAKLPEGTDVFIAKRKVEETMIEVQTQGWYFNTDTSFKLLPDADGFISLSPNILKIDFNNYEEPNRYVRRNNSVYDIKEHTFKINKTILGDIIWLNQYDELPPTAYNYIKVKAARKFQQRVIGSDTLTKYNVSDEIEAQVALDREQLEYMKYNLRANNLRRDTNVFLREGMRNG